MAALERQATLKIGASLMQTTRSFVPRDWMATNGAVDAIRVAIVGMWGDAAP